MPPRAKKPAEPTPFDQAQATYDALVEAQPIEQDALLGALEVLRQTGQTALKARQVTGAGLTRALRDRYATALSKNEAGNVQPPLEEAFAQNLGAQVMAFETVISQEPDDKPPTPSKPAKTDDRKGS